MCQCNFKMISRKLILIYLIFHYLMAEKAIAEPTKPIEEAKVTAIVQPKIQYKLSPMEIPTISDIKQSYYPHLDSEKEHASAIYSRTTRISSKPSNMSAGGSKPYALEEKEHLSSLNSMMALHLQTCRL